MDPRQSGTESMFLMPPHCLLKGKVEIIMILRKVK